MADRKASSPVCWDVAGLAGLSKAISLTGIRVGDVISSTVPWAKANPVIAPHVLRLTSAVACCHVGFLSGGTGSPAFSSSVGPDECANGALNSVSCSLLHVRQRLEDRLDLRVSWVVGVGEQHADVVGRGGRRTDHPLPVRVGDQGRLTSRARYRQRAEAGEARMRDD